MSLFDRHENLRKWAHAWSMCEKQDTSLHVVNSKYPSLDAKFWYKYCKDRNINYYQRANEGYETRLIQEASLGKVGGNWDYMIFVTDDTLPMKKDFIKRYVDKVLDPNVGVSYMEDSEVTAPHIRTTGFCISREVARNLTFPRNNALVQSKGDCYHFEHTGGEETFRAQILKMGKDIVQVDPLEESSLWDTHTTNFNRWDEWHSEFPGYIG